MDWEQGGSNIHRWSMRQFRAWISAHQHPSLQRILCPTIWGEKLHRKVMVRDDHAWFGSHGSLNWRILWRFIPICIPTRLFLTMIISYSDTWPNDSCSPCLIIIIHDLTLNLCIKYRWMASKWIDLPPNMKEGIHLQTPHRPPFDSYKIWTPSILKMVLNFNDVIEFGCPFDNGF